MTELERKRDFEKVAAIVSDAGGRVVGRTRLQKLAYLLEVTGLGDGFQFDYRHYGPYSEDLAEATQIANLVGLLTEEERPTSWGGFYSIFTTVGHEQKDEHTQRCLLARVAASADPVELELAATAAFLALRGAKFPWEETTNRKPEKAKGGRIERARKLYEELQKINTPVSLPEIRLP